MAKIGASLGNLISGGMEVSIISSFTLFIQSLQTSDGVLGIMADYQNLIQIEVPIVAAELNVTSLLKQVKTAFGTCLVAI